MQKFVKSILPQKTYELAKRLYKEKVTHYRRDIYSEFGEDFIAAVLLGFKENGFYVDVGAFRPKELSVTYYFYRKLGWSGLVVEPNPAAASLFKKQRPRDIFINRGVAAQRETLTYYEFNDPTLNSFSRNVYEQNRNSLTRQSAIDVEPLSKILNSHLDQGQKIDLMNIDVEGLDFEVLKSNDWARFSPKVIVVEDHSFKPETPLESEIVRFLKDQGYQLKANCLISLVFELEGCR